MYSLILFIVICLAQYGFYRWKKSDIEDYQSVASGIADFSGVSKRILYGRIVIFLSNMQSMVTRFLWPFVLIILFVNFLLSVILGSLIHLIVSLF